MGGGVEKCHCACRLYPLRLLLALSAHIGAAGLSLPCSAAIILHLKRICFGGQETKLSVSSVRHQKAQLRGLPSKGACREIKMRAKPGLNQASVWSPSIGGGSVRSRATAAAVPTSRVCVSQGRRSDF